MADCSCSRGGNAASCEHHDKLPTEKHYHVLYSMEGGYMPDSNVYCGTIEDARTYAREESKREAEQESDDEVTVTAVVSDAAELGDVIIMETKPCSKYHLRHYYEVIDCTEDGCEDFEG